jgi:hypothetical protein
MILYIAVIYITILCMSYGCSHQWDNQCPIIGWDLELDHGWDDQQPS